MRFWLLSCGIFGTTTRNETLGIETLTLRITDDEKEEFSKLGKNEGGSINQDVTKILEKLCKTAMCAISNIWDTDAAASLVSIGLLTP